MLRLLPLLILILIPVAQSQEVYEQNVIEKLAVGHKIFKEPMQFNVTLPPSYQEAKDKRYFVIFDIHPRSQPYLSGLHDWLSHNGDWPWLETIVVTPANYHQEFATLFEQTAENPDDERMLDFLQLDVLKQVNSRYRTNGFNIYSGFMSNGAIGLYALLNRPDMFNAYLIASPTLGDDFLDIVPDAKEKFAKLSDKVRFLRINIGDHQFETGHVEAVKKIEQILAVAAPDDLNWNVKLHDEHYYMSRPVFTVLEGIEALFDDYHNDLPLDSPVVKAGVDAIIEHYKKLSERKYGFVISAEGTLKRLARSLLDNDAEQAMSIYRRVVELYPGSTYAQADLAAAYKTLGNIDKAIEHQKLAVSNSSTLITWHQDRMKQKLEEYQGLKQ